MSSRGPRSSDVLIRRLSVPAFPEVLGGIRGYELDRLDFLVDLYPRGTNDAGFGHLDLEVGVVDEGLRQLEGSSGVEEADGDGTAVRETEVASSHRDSILAERNHARGID